MTFLKVTLCLLSAAAKLYEKFQSKSLMLMITRGHRILCTGINSQVLYFLFKKNWYIKSAAGYRDSTYIVVYRMDRNSNIAKIRAILFWSLSGTLDLVFPPFSPRRSVVSLVRRMIVSSLSHWASTFVCNVKGVTHESRGLSAAAETCSLNSQPIWSAICGSESSSGNIEVRATLLI